MHYSDIFITTADSYEPPDKVTLHNVWCITTPHGLLIREHSVWGIHYRRKTLLKRFKCILDGKNYRLKHYKKIKLASHVACDVLYYLTREQ